MGHNATVRTTGQARECSQPVDLADESALPVRIFFCQARPGLANGFYSLQARVRTNELRVQPSQTIKHRAVDRLSFSPTEWQALVTGKAGEFGREKPQ